MLFDSWGRGRHSGTYIVNRCFALNLSTIPYYISHYTTLYTLRFLGGFVKKCHALLGCSLSVYNPVIWLMCCSLSDYSLILHCIMLYYRLPFYTTILSMLFDTWGSLSKIYCSLLCCALSLYNPMLYSTVLYSRLFDSSRGVLEKCVVHCWVAICLQPFSTLHDAILDTLYSILFDSWGALWNIWCSLLCCSLSLYNPMLFYTAL